jgi:hypothetical protein
MQMLCVQYADWIDGMCIFWCLEEHAIQKLSHNAAIWPWCHRLLNICIFVKQQRKSINNNCINKLW